MQKTIVNFFYKFVFRKLQRIESKSSVQMYEKILTLNIKCDPSNKHAIIKKIG